MTRKIPLSENISFLSPIAQALSLQELDSINFLLKNITISSQMSSDIQKKAHFLINGARKEAFGGLLRHFLVSHDLASPAGITLMCLAESLLRIPDKATADALLTTVLKSSLLASLTLPVVRQGIRLLGGQFVMGETIQSAIKAMKAPYCYSFDMLGEAAKTQADADRYFQAYKDAIMALENVPNCGISVKLSALHPRYQYTQIERLERELVPKIIELARLAKYYHIDFIIDAEEADRLQLSLLLIKQVLASSELDGWDGFGLAVQAYQKAAPAVLDVCHDLAKNSKHRLKIRLVKGAYWDTEIKRAQERGFAQYPVYTRKVATDVSYLFCAQKLFKHRDVFYPQLATHNAHTIASVLQMADGNRDFEFQRLYGMGENLYDTLLAQEDVTVRVYAPIGDYQHLLAYLVRRLLENGANSSFVHQVEDHDIAIEDLIADPIDKLKNLEIKENPKIPLPKELYGDLRENSFGFDLSDFETQKFVLTRLNQNPQQVRGDNSLSLPDMLKKADHAFFAWSKISVEQRCIYLNKAADLLAKHQFELMNLLIHEGKKTITDTQSEVREAIDYCRYYALEAKRIMAAQILPGPTGESNTLTFQGRGVAACISPWNFPLAIFLGQIVAALVTGNTVVAKPAAQTPQIAIRAVELLHQAGIPKDVLQLIIGEGRVIGDALTQDPRVALVVFTGSLETAQHINKNLAQRKGAIPSLIAETGGQNAMIVDSSALLEQVVSDVITSAFNSAGQRCSALRILCLQEEIFDSCVNMLTGAMAELKIGNPSLLSTDVGPVIDDNAKSALDKHIKDMNKSARIIYQMPLQNQDDTYVAPTLIEIDNINVLKREVFGPVLHVLRFQRKRLPELLKALNDTGYGLTLGIHSRIEPFVNDIISHTFVGNNYVNRNMIGAVVGVQPFGGQHCSGTGPKAGGPHYLSRFITEKTITINTAAIGGNASLLDLDV
ncbi:MAG: L-glutamate gamma-semialdehyde dehydrogenase [Legionellales bacterium]|jgi:RHH-type proline utilization regulon transcriptional repressor/proline dehydrogenase/delta 1-pyrroline-5-carboxylate dehydrogenase